MAWFFLISRQFPSWNQRMEAEEIAQWDTVEGKSTPVHCLFPYLTW
ncbi:hypothetical protein [Mangrovibacillus cuniculi]|uniref:Uncharacterized protein n=1 Tax=Mangrovibacillus cuniculi TaxID=2593652 RepID=A0A7S8C901_9BACI|nr:hypothetical protein [Mangrovibacillus cuniculi]QPC45616.1 hypothetical protein G8O30_00800 [Mangrovibacillus cuniculi]